VNKSGLRETGAPVGPSGREAALECSKAALQRVHSPPRGFQDRIPELHPLERCSMSVTESNLKEAFAGESQANRKYVAFAKKAEQEGFINVARLFRTAAEAETIHALGYLGAMDGVGSTVDNLRAAVAGDTYEYTQMYPPMLQQARAEDHRAKRMFGYAMKAEAVHARLYQIALEAVAQGKHLAETKFYLCPVRGHIEMGEPPYPVRFAARKGRDSFRSRGNCEEDCGASGRWDGKLSWTVPR